MAKLRPGQAEMLRYRGGLMGVSAVPGSGKTFTLSLLAAELIKEGLLEDHQEVLIVTLTNAAVDNFATRIAALMKENGLLPNVGYRVRTLHGLAHDIVRERPDLAGLSERFEILDEFECQEILDNEIYNWKRKHPGFVDDWRDLDDYDRDEDPDYDWQNKLNRLANAFIRLAKDLRASPDDIRSRLAARKYTHPLLEFCLEVYTAYQRHLAARSAVDFDDLIQLSLQALQSDADFLERLRRRWPYILEDEAQDSTRLQEEVLRTLCGDQGNWVRVGDPNQAINETFTTASPKFLRDFLNEPGVVARNLPESGRSARTIRQLANFLIRWTIDDHPVPELRSALTPPFIQPPPPGDPQSENASRPGMVYIHDKPLTPEREVEVVVKSVGEWVDQNPDKTVAILVPRNRRGMRFVEALQKAKIPHLEILKNTQRYRDTVETIESVLDYLARPDSRSLAELYKKVRRRRFEHPDTQKTCKTAVQLIQSCTQIEDYLAPQAERDWLASKKSSLSPEVYDELAAFQALVRRWHAAVLLPIDQIVMTIGQDLFTPANREAALGRDTLTDLALCERIARLLEKTADQNPSFNLKDFADRLRALKRSTALSRFGDDEFGFNPRDHCGEVVVTTIHKAKGLEWDRVYLTSANNFDFPSLQPDDRYQSERGARGRLNLEAEVLQKLTALMSDEGDVPGLFLEDGAASLQARVDYCSERLRLFYVAITRACQELLISYNTGRKKARLRAALPLVAVKSYLDQIES